MVNHYLRCAPAVAEPQLESSWSLRHTVQESSVGRNHKKQVLDEDLSSKCANNGHPWVSVICGTECLYVACQKKQVCFMALILSFGINDLKRQERVSNPYGEHSRTEGSRKPQYLLFVETDLCKSPSWREKQREAGPARTLVASQHQMATVSSL